MNTQFGDGINDSAIIMLAELILKRAGLKGLFVRTRPQALNIIRGVKLPPHRSQPHGIAPAVDKPSRCSRCRAPLHFGQPCKSNVNEHIECKQKRELYQKALDSLTYA
jgi:hypothetical protein